jgi:hypothetical protein
LKVEVKFNTKLTEIERGLAIPLVDIATALLDSMEERIDRGEAAVGRFRPLGADSKPTGRGGLFWVSPGKPHPTGYVVKPSQGKLAGWAGYRNYKAYAEALGNPPRDFNITGQLRSSRRVKIMGPGRVSIKHYGAHSPSATPDGKTTRSSNSNVAWLASRLERDPMLMPTAKEFDEIRQQTLAHFEALVAAGSAQDARSAKRGKARRPASAGRR